MKTMWLELPKMPIVIHGGAMSGRAETNFEVRVWARNEQV